VIRRILLIDADPAFRALLTQQLARYQFEIAAEPDPDQALAPGVEPPALLMVAVDEPDKAGFKVFQRCKRSAFAKVPIMLVTSSVAPDSFAKHRGLKVHADEYFDKRSPSHQELLSKVDLLVGLGSPGEAESDSAFDVDEISLSGEDMVLEETVGEDDAGELELDPGAPPERAVDSMVDVETDAAFAALLGGGAEPAGPTASAGPQIPQLTDTPRTSDDEPSVVIAAVPAPIHDTGRAQDSGSVDFDSFSREAMRPPVELIARARHDHRAQARTIPGRRPTGSEPPAEVRSETPPAIQPEARTETRTETRPAIPIDVDDLEQVDDSAAHRLAAHAQPVAGDPTAAIARVEPTPRPGALRAQPSTEPPPITATGPVPIDLGLDDLAASDASVGASAPSGTATDHSGAYDRRALRQLGELERQITQLKTELDRARATADASARGAGREREFLNLREQITAKDKDLQRARDELRARDRELGDAQDRLRTTEQARLALEARAGELEQRAASDANRAAALELRDQSQVRQLAALHGELDVRSHAASSAEAARVQIERELASERALRAASASEAERALRVEREQLIARHQGELAAIRSEGATARDQAVQAIRDEIAAEHATAVAAAVAGAHSEAAAAAERALRQAMAEHADQLAQYQASQIAQLEQLTGERDAALARVASEREAALAAAAAEHQRMLVRLQIERAAELNHVKQDADNRFAALATARDRAISELTTELERHKHQLGAVRGEHEQALGSAAAETARALDDQARQHADELAAQEREFAAERTREAAAHAEALAAIKLEGDRQAGHQAGTLAGLRVQLNQANEHHEQARRQLIEQHRTASAELAAAHADELARARAEPLHRIDELQRALAEAHAAADRLAAQHRSDLDQRSELSARQAADHAAALDSAQRALEDASARYDSEREAARRAATKALDDARLQYDRALAAETAELARHRATADAEHQRAIAAAAAEFERQRNDAAAAHAAATADLATERDELRRGLSSARDSLKRGEAELATAVQTIADRNAELRAHAAAIAERDQRIAELRSELEGLEHENASYQEQVLRAYQKIKADEAMVARAKKAMAIALTVLDPGDPKAEPT
jgi:CheY-like chemotaxis protein